MSCGTMPIIFLIDDNSECKSFPSIRTFPVLGGKRPQRIEIVVVLPAPLGPSKPNISFRFIEKEILLTAGSVACLKVLVKFCISMIAGLLILLLKPTATDIH